MFTEPNHIILSSSYNPSENINVVETHSTGPCPKRSCYSEDIIIVKPLVHQNFMNFDELQISKYNDAISLWQ